MTPDKSSCREPLSIVRSRATSYLEGHMHRLLSSLFVALALLLSPMAMASGAMANTAHADTPHGAVAAAAHCAGHEMPAPVNEQPEHLSCAATCAALPALPAASGVAPALLSARLVAAPNHALIGFKPEGETPPPRITPVI